MLKCWELIWLCFFWRIGIRDFPCERPTDAGWKISSLKEMGAELLRATPTQGYLPAWATWLWASHRKIVSASRFRKKGPLHKFKGPQMYVCKKKQEDFKKNKAKPSEFQIVYYRGTNCTANTALLPLQAYRALFVPWGVKQELILLGCEINPACASLSWKKPSKRLPQKHLRPSLQSSLSPHCSHPSALRAHVLTDKTHSSSIPSNVGRSRSPEMNAGVI